MTQSERDTPEGPNAQVVDCWNELPAMSPDCDVCLRALAVGAAKRLKVPETEQADIAQDVLLRVWHRSRAPGFPLREGTTPNPEAVVRAYIYQVAYNLVVDRSRRRRPVLTQDGDVESEIREPMVETSDDDLAGKVEELRAFVAARFPRWVEAFDARLGLALGRVSWTELLARSNRAAWDQRFKRLKDRVSDAIGADPDADRRERLAPIHAALFGVKSDPRRTERLEDMQPNSTRLLRPKAAQGTGYAGGHYAVPDLEILGSEAVDAPLLERAGLSVRAHADGALSILFDSRMTVHLSDLGAGAHLTPAAGGLHVVIAPAGLTRPLEVRAGAGVLLLEPDGDAVKASLRAASDPLPDPAPLEALADSIADRLGWLADAMDEALRRDGPELGPLLAAALADAYDEEWLEGPEPLLPGPGARWFGELAPEGMASAALELVGGALLVDVADIGGVAEAPSPQNATLWLCDDAVPKGWTSPALAGDILKAHGIAFQLLAPAALRCYTKRQHDDRLFARTSRGCDGR
jgi:hypothetical protein